MPIDEATLERFRRYTDPALGISEEFLQPTLGSTSTVAVLSRPLHSAMPLGLVMCPSLGTEQTNLSQLQVATARALSAAGFPVLRFHGRGYGDSRASMSEFSVTSAVAEAADAVRLMSDQDGVERTGIMGTKFGGMVAAMAADRTDISMMVLWEPVTNGAQWMRDFVRSQLLHEIVQTGAQRGSGTQRIRDEIEEQGWASIRGFVLSREAYQEVMAVDLLTEICSFSGAALVVSVSARGRATPGVTKLTARLRELGAACTEELVQDNAAGQLGQRAALVLPGVKMIDVLGNVAEQVTGITISWALRELSLPGGGTEDVAAGSLERKASRG